MRIKGLRKKTSLVVIIPLLIGVILTRLAGLIPTYIFYPNMLDTYAKNMISNQKEYLQNSSYILSKIVSSNYIQQLTNSINIGGDLMQLHYFYGLKVKKTLNPSSILINFYEYLDKHPSHERLYNQSMWFLDDYQDYNSAPLSAKLDLNTSAIFDTIMRVISKQSQKQLKKTYSTSYLAFSDNGIYCTNPSRYSNFTSSRKCVYSDDGYYDPRCSLFYNLTLGQRGISNAVIIPPYRYEGNTTYGQSVCRGQWNYTNSNLLMTYCIDFNISNYFTSDKIFQGQLADYDIYSYIVSNKGIILQYDKRFDPRMINMSITEEEMSKSNKDEKTYYNDKIFPLFLYQNRKLTHYYKNGHKMIISVCPVMITTTDPANPIHYASVALVMKNEKLKKKFNDLIALCNKSLNVGNIFGGVFVFIIAILCILLTDSLSKSLISPIDDLVKILNRMIEGDLEADILASIKPAPKEVQDLYEVFNKLRVVLRFTTIHTKDLTEAGLIYSQALKLFTQFGNSTALEICYRELGYICAQKELWQDASNFLTSALEIFLTYTEIEPLECCKRKLEVAGVIMKSKENMEKGLILIGECFEELTKLEVVPEVCEYLLELAEIVYEAGAKSSRYLKDLHSYINICEFEDKGIIRQRYMYIKALYLKNNRNYQESCKSLIFLLEEFPTYIPVIRMKSINILKAMSSSVEINEQLSRHNPSERPTSKDVVLIVSNSLAQEAISSKIKDFAGCLINKNDRLALIQSYCKPLVVFSLTKLPMNIMEFKVNDLSLGFCFMDSLKIAIRHLRVKDHFTHVQRKRQSWIVVITDLQETDRACQPSEVVDGLEELDINVVVVDLSGKSEEFYFLYECSRFNIVFEGVDYENFERVLKEVVAFICPEKEVIDFKDRDEDALDIIYY